MADGKHGVERDELEPLLSPQDRALLEEFLGTQEALLKAASTGAITTYTPQNHQLPFHQSPCSNRWFVGANRTGKTWACYQEIRWFALGEHPYRDLPPAKLIWVVCPTAELSTLYHQPGVIEAIGWDNIREYKRGAIPMLILKNGCQIVFKYYSQGPKAFPSAGVDLVFCDEEPPWPIFEEMWSRRSAGRTLNIIGANTMVLGFTWIYDYVIQKRLPDTDWFSASLDDNLFISEQERERMKAGLKNNKTMYAIRVEGKILPVGGMMRFDAGVLAKMFQKGIREPKARFDFDFEHERWVQNEEGRLSIYDMPIPGHEYVMGVDVAEGLNISYSDAEPVFDETSCQILNRTYRRFDADYTAGDIEPVDIGKYIVPRLHLLFNNCKVNIELNLHGHTVAGFARDHCRSALWSPTADRAAKGPRQVRRLGTLISSTSRRFMIDVFADAISNEDVEIPSGPTLQQCMGFVKKANGRVEHQDGMKDDRVFACGHALVCDRDLPAPTVVRPETIRDQLRKIATATNQKERKLQWWRKVS